MEPPTVRLAVVGAGMMGANHARVARNLRGASVLAVVDPDIERARAAAAASGAIATTSIDDIVGEVDAAVVVVPTAQHVPVALQLLEAGVHVLVEKPIAASVEDAQLIIDAARRSGVVLAVGHVERFNAAVAELPKFMDEPLHIEASRISPFSARVPDGVVFDLMIHDLDIVLWIAGPDATVEHVSGVGRAVRGLTEDIATATVRFSSGLTATFNTSRLGQQKIRSLEITQLESVVVADLVRQDLTIHRMSRHEYLSGDGSRYRQSSVMEIPFLETRGEPLAHELQSFVDSIRGGTRPQVSGEDGQRALELAHRIKASLH